MKNQKKKTSLFNILSFAAILIAGYATTVGETAQAWMGIAVFVITGFLNFAYNKSGEFIASGWKIGQWAVVIAGVVIQVGNLIVDGGLLPAKIINLILIGLTLYVQQFGKTYNIPAATNV